MSLFAILPLLLLAASADARIPDRTFLTFVGRACPQWLGWAPKPEYATTDPNVFDKKKLLADYHYKGFTINSMESITADVRDQFCDWSLSTKKAYTVIADADNELIQGWPKNLCSIFSVPMQGLQDLRENIEAYAEYNPAPFNDKTSYPSSVSDYINILRVYYKMINLVRDDSCLDDLQ